MALITVVVYGTDKNEREPLARRSLASLAETVNWERHRLFIVDNGSTEPMKLLLDEAKNWMPFTLITNEANRGTARAQNQGWLNRKPGEHCLKCDEDVVWHEDNWADKLEECIQRDPLIGVVGLKRKDLDEWPTAPKGCWSRSSLIPLAHTKGQRWLSVEVVEHVMSTCAMYNSAAIDKVGYLATFGLYGLDDSIMCTRIKVSGFYSCFYHHFEIDHIDPGNTPFQTWKCMVAGDKMYKFDRLKAGLVTGKIDPYFGPDVDLDLLYDWH